MYAILWSFPIADHFREQLPYGGWAGQFGCWISSIGRGRGGSVRSPAGFNCTVPYCPARIWFCLSVFSWGPNGSDSIAVQLARASHWPEISAIILIVKARKKDVSSTLGMQRNVATSELFRARAETVVPRSTKQIEKAIHDKDFEAFENITMREFNSSQATCLDTSPPIVYLNDVSRAATEVVEAINSAAWKIIAAYTFDAGSNAVMFYERKNSDAVSGMFSRILEIRENNVEEID
ncbi:diphosphomevalonate decarboxylase [Clarireedia jacksonii]